MDYGWSSYLTHISDKTTNLKKAEVLDLFDDLENFKAIHNISINMPNLEF